MSGTGQYDQDPCCNHNEDVFCPSVAYKPRQSQQLLSIILPLSISPMTSQPVLASGLALNLALADIPRVLIGGRFRFTLARPDSPLFGKAATFASSGKVYDDGGDTIVWRGTLEFDTKKHLVVAKARLTAGGATKLITEAKVYEGLLKNLQGVNIPKFWGLYEQLEEDDSDDDAEDEDDEDDEDNEDNRAYTRPPFQIRAVALFSDCGDALESTELLQEESVEFRCVIELSL